MKMTRNDKSAKKPQQTVEQELPFLTHLVELRDRLIRVVAVVGLITLGLMTVANDLYYYFSLPIQGYLPEGHAMLATGVVSPVFTPFKLALIAAFFISIPLPCIRPGRLLRRDYTNMKSAWLFHY